jgi:hypothetical protein
LKVNKTADESKFWKIDTPNNSKCYSASKYLENLNYTQSYRSVKIETSRRVVESHPVCLDLKGPYRPDAIRQRDANFQFSMTFNFTIFLCFSNIRNHLSNFSYLVCIFVKFLSVDGFICF